MSDVLTIAGSPSPTSRSADILAYIRELLERQRLTTDAIRVRDLDPEELLHARFDGASVRESIAKVLEARAIIIATRLQSCLLWHSESVFRPAATGKPSPTKWCCPLQQAAHLPICSRLIMRSSLCCLR
jgi:hypothetical protein